MKKWIFALGCAALFAVACSDDSSSTVKASDTVGVDDNLSQQNESSSSKADSSESDEESSIKIKKTETNDDEETDSDVTESSESKLSSISFPSSESVDLT